MYQFIMNVKSFFLFLILLETKEKLFSLLLRILLRMLLPIFIFIQLALWHYLSLVQSMVKIFAFCFSNVLSLPFSFG